MPIIDAHQHVWDPTHAAICSRKTGSGRALLAAGHSAWNDAARFRRTGSGRRR